MGEISGRMSVMKVRILLQSEKLSTNMPVTFLIQRPPLTRVFNSSHLGCQFEVLPVQGSPTLERRCSILQLEASLLWDVSYL
jgi:hypothetical protein